MEDPERDYIDRIELYARIGFNASYIRKLLGEFHCCMEDGGVRKELRYLPYVYVELIVIKLAIIFSTSSNETYTLKKFSSVTPSKDMKDQVQKILSLNKELIAKINNNRSKLFAHFDRDFYKFGFSIEEIERMEERFQTKLPQLHPVDRSKQIYTPTDLKKDAKEVNTLLVQIEEIMQKAIENDALNHVVVASSKSTPS